MPHGVSRHALGQTVCFAADSRLLGTGRKAIARVRFGSGHPVTKTFYHLKPTAQGKLNLTFEPVTNYATVSAIEVIDELSVARQLPWQ